MSILLRVFVLLRLLIQGTLVNDAVEYAYSKGAIAEDLLEGQGRVIVNFAIIEGNWVS